MKIKAFLLIIAISIFGTTFANNTRCPLVNGINVHTKSQVLNICKHGTVVKSFKVALGYKGVGKRKAGDNKTPLGLYGLAAPRKSNQFNVFIPILYPNSKQRAQGYTGRDVGIHGPKQTTKWFSWLGNLPNWTRGCVAVGSNSHIEYVANWLKTNGHAKVLII